MWDSSIKDILLLDKEKNLLSILLTFPMFFFYKFTWKWKFFLFHTFNKISAVWFSIIHRCSKRLMNDSLQLLIKLTAFFYLFKHSNMSLNTKKNSILIQVQTQIIESLRKPTIFQNWSAFNTCWKYFMRVSRKNVDHHFKRYTSMLTFEFF